MIPGIDLLDMALSIIAPQTLTYYQNTGRTLNAVGQDVALYAPGTIIEGSFQPVPRKLYEAYGLNLQKDYFILYVSLDVFDVTRDISGDQLGYQGQRFQCESNTEWFRSDYWKAVFCVRVGLDSTDTQQFGFNEKPSINTYKNFSNSNFLTPEVTI